MINSYLDESSSMNIFFLLIITECVKYPTEIERRRKATHHWTVYHHGKYHKIAHNYGKSNISESIKLTSFFQQAVRGRRKKKTNQKNPTQTKTTWAEKYINIVTQQS